MSETKADTVPGLGFKDKEKALETIKNLEGRDPDYQKLAIKGLIGRAKRTLTLTKDKEKLQNINEAMSVFENWLKNFELSNMSKENRAYLPLASIEALLPLKEKFSIEDNRIDEFLAAYKKANADYKNLRTVSSGEDQPTWDIVRNTELKKLLKGLEETRPDLWKDDLPTKEHMEIILWAYSPDASKIKKNVSTYEEKLASVKITDDDADSEEENKEKDEEKEEKPEEKESKPEKRQEKRSSKRRSSGDSSEDEEESPKKKNKDD
ncbi:hypothetical protein NQ318_018120 [Aromia moschata]|uniref:Uncharacterized protein n=1 Tax=Aromia moschata TaxID=1265417 RepID=A0AAV8ZFJ5_9CUCU|nr:hypothetical protein NQ318_018120 [Aromia moschata]